MSCTNVDSEGLIWKFDIRNNNTGVMNISSPLLNTKEKAEEAAMAAFLKNSFAINPVDFSTWVTDYYLNKVIKVGGLNYLIKSITTAGDDTKIVTAISGERYDD